MTIRRRDILKTGAALWAVSLVPGEARALPAASFAPHPGAWRNFEITTHVEIADRHGPARVWVPLPAFAADDWIRPLGDDWQAGDGAASVHKVGRYGAKMLSIEWAGGTAPAVADIRSRVATRDRAVDLTQPGKPAALSAAERRLFTAPTALIPTDGIVKDTADKITAGAKGDLAKAQRLYDWIVANTFRDPKTRGCGLGNIAFMLRSGDLGGKCADINALFVGLARAVGLPARDLYGIRVAPSQFGYKSLGANSETITGAQHCRTEVWLSGFGWVPVDPADVRKVALEEPPGHLAMTDAKVEAARQTLFGAWETNWIAYNDAHDVALPGAADGPVAFLMYPQGETAAGRLDCLDAAAFRYAITAREIAA
jgi:transglutaminase-like putative cysteine protease